VLVDSRFRDAELLDTLYDWAKPCVQLYTETGKLAEDLMHFYRQNSERNSLVADLKPINVEAPKLLGKRLHN
jgi:hypothetical protein